MPDPAEAQGLGKEFLDVGIPPIFLGWYSARSNLSSSANQAPLATDSVLADPVIAEALEALHLHNPDRKPDSAEVEVDEIDPGKALEGLKRLKSGQEIGGLCLPEPAVISDTITHIRNSGTGNNRPDETASSPTAGSEKEIGGASEPEKAKTRSEAQAEHDETRHTLSEILFTTIREKHPDLDLDDYISLYEKVSGRLNNGDGVEVRGGKGFHKLLSEMVEELTQDPERLGNLSCACILLPYLNQAVGTKASLVLKPYLEFVKHEVWSQLEITEVDVNKMSSEVLNEWFEYIDQTPIDIQRLTDRLLGLPTQEFQRTPPEILKPLLASRHFSQFIFNDFTKTIDRHTPLPLVDKVHRLVEHAFDTDVDYQAAPEERRSQLNQSSRINQTLGIIDSLFKQRLVASMIFVNGAGSNMLPMESRLKLIDLKLFFGEIGGNNIFAVPTGGSLAIFGGDDKSGRLLERVFPHREATIKTTPFSSQPVLKPDKEAIAEIMKATSEEFAQRIGSEGSENSYLMNRYIKITPDEIRAIPVAYR